LTNDKLAEEVKRICNKEIIVCDSSEPKSVAELQQYGVKAIGAKKGRDSVVFGVQWLQQQKIVVDVNCMALKSELQQYKWQEDKDGNVLPKPVDRHNHLIDSMRYALEFDMGIPYSETPEEKLSGKDRLMSRYYELKRTIGFGRS
jgi:phage terminase large subunit